MYVCLSVYVYIQIHIEAQKESNGDLRLLLFSFACRGNSHLQAYRQFLVWCSGFMGFWKIEPRAPSVEHML